MMLCILRFVRCLDLKEKFEMPDVALCVLMVVSFIISVFYIANAVCEWQFCGREVPLVGTLLIITTVFLACWFIGYCSAPYRYIDPRVYPITKAADTYVVVTADRPTEPEVLNFCKHFGRLPKENERVQIEVPDTGYYFGVWTVDNGKPKHPRITLVENANP